MVGGLLGELLEAALVTQAQLRAAGIEGEDPPSADWLERLVAEGLDECALAGFFVSRGFGPLLGPEELGQADAALLKSLSAQTAHACCAVPVRESPAGVVVAMANPRNEEAVRVIEDLLCDAVVPIVAKLSDLQSALRVLYPQASPTPLRREPLDDESRKAPKLASPNTRSGPPKTGRDSGLSLSALVTKTSPAWDRAWDAVPQSALTSLYAPSQDEFERNNANLNRARARFAMAQTRDELVQLACDACLNIARAAAFLALRKGVLRGWYAVGEELDPASIQSLWVPSSNPSMLTDVVGTGTAFRGPYGQTAADHLFRAALGGRGEQVSIAPVLIGDRLIGLLCANDPFGPPDAVAQIAADVGKSLQRMLVAQKT